MPMLCNYLVHLLLSAAPCSTKPQSLLGTSATSDRMHWQRGKWEWLGCLGLMLWFKQFPAMGDMIKMTKRLGKVLQLTLYILPGATQMHTIIRDVNSGARVGGMHLASPGFCQFASNLLFHWQYLNEMYICLVLHWISSWFLKQNQTIHGRLWNMQCFPMR